MNKTIRPLLALLMIVTLLISGAYTVYSDLAEGSNGMVFEILEDGGAVLRKLTYIPFTEVTVPDSYNGHPVTAIGSGAFNGCSFVTKITLPDSVTEIGPYAFMECVRLKSINMPASLKKIGNSAFMSCYLLTDIQLPYGIEDIDICAFENCTALENIVIPDTVRHIGARILEHTKFYDDQSNRDGLGLYAGNCFIARSDGAKGDVKIKEGTLLIADNAFPGTGGLTSVTIPASVEYIGSSNFMYLSKGFRLTVSEDNQNYKMNNKCLISRRDRMILRGFEYCEFPEGALIESIDSYAFYGGMMAGDVVIPDTVESIGDYAFGFCSGISSVAFPDGLRTIGSGAFESCGITEITIPGSVERIGSAAFARCLHLASVTINAEKIDIGAEAFYTTVFTNDPANWTDDGFLYSGSCLIASDHRIGNFTVRNGTTSIADHVFGIDMKEITLPASVGFISEKAFLDPSEQSIIALSGTYAEKYAADHSIRFIRDDELTGFSDVSPTAWYYPYVRFVVNREYFFGISPTEFAPSVILTRAMFVVVLARFEGIDVNDNIKYNGANYFEDIDPSSWYAAAAGWAYENGIVSGVTDYIFAPNARLTREQMAVMIQKYLRFKKFNLIADYKDALDVFPDKDDISTWAVDSMGWAVSAKLFAGSDGKLLPMEGVTRAQTCVITKALKTLTEEKTHGVRLDLDTVNRIISNAYTLNPDNNVDMIFTEIMKNIQFRFPVPDFAINTSDNVTVLEYWFDDEGKDKILITASYQTIYYSSDGSVTRLFPKYNPYVPIVTG
ncbi:MAG: leucine-rich repeat protein [Clostridia bacterium]|nr:leucine-rich repeat protein [Clostridia bacterium]